LAFIVRNQRCKIQPFIQHSRVETKQNTRQGIVAFPTQDAPLRQSVVEKKNRSSVATEPRTGTSKYMPKQVHHTDGTYEYNEIELSVKMSTRSFGVKYEQFQRGEQPYSAAGYGRSFSPKSVLKEHVFHILGIVRNPVICVMCIELSLRNIQYTDRLTISSF
jgi:hypothetical protein